MSRLRSCPNADFVCKRCQAYVSAVVILAGVHNRNHCPYCLWSRHLDLFKAGDRLAACKGVMRPIGLTCKQTFKRYNPGNSPGELMLVHYCTECEMISINRIAADDDAEAVLALCEPLLDAALAASLLHQGIRLLGRQDRQAVQVQLFGLRELMPC